jgi:UDP:flavonoid glycosyltransferase YjiC (YdhE family)
MAKILLTMIVSNDLGPATRMLPVASELTSRGHDVAFCNRAPAPAQVIAEAGYQNFNVVPSQSPTIFPDVFSAEIWNGNQGAAYMGFLDADFIRALAQDYVAMMEKYDPDVVIDTWGLPACLAAKILRKPLVTITQADNHPDADGYIWWRPAPANLPNPIPAVNTILEECGLPLLKNKIEELFLGNVVLIVGTPDTDPLPRHSDVTYVGPLHRRSKQEELPDWLAKLPQHQPLIWVYSGNPRYGKDPSIADSIVVIRAAVSALGNEAVQVVLTTGHQPLPDEFNALPPNIHFTSHVPGAAMARKSDLFIHHGGHGSYLTGLAAGTPAVIVPTYSERESNARRLASMGAGEYVLPSTGNDGEKVIPLDEFRTKVWRVLENNAYRQSAQRIADKMAAYTGPEQVADEVEALLAISDERKTRS